MAYGSTKAVHARRAASYYASAARAMAGAKRRANNGECDVARALLKSAMVSVGRAEAHAESHLRGSKFSKYSDKISKLWLAAFRTEGVIRRRCYGGR